MLDLARLWSGLPPARRRDRDGRRLAFTAAVMRVLHVVLSLEVGGLERVVLDLVKHRDREAIEPHLCCLTILGRLGEALLKQERIPVSILNKPPGIRLSLVTRIARIVRDAKIDVIHTHNVAAHFYGSLAGLIRNVPVIHTKHGRNNPADGGEVTLSFLASLNTRRVCAVSANAADVAIRIEHIAKRKVCVVPNGVDVALYGGILTGAASLRREIGAGESDYVCGVVARLSGEKDHATLLAAFGEFSVVHPDAHLVIVGDGPLRNSLVEQACAAGLSGSVHFLGERSDVSELLGQLDLFLLSSRTEGIPVTILEAMAARIPVVSTNVGGIPEVVVEGVTGFLVPPGSPRALADRMTILYADRKLSASMGRAGRTQVSKHHSIASTVREYERIYREFA